MKISLFLIALFIFCNAFGNELMGLTYQQRVWAKLSHPLLNQGLVNKSNVKKVQALGRNYARSNTINPAWLGLFRRYNSSETMQNRTVLDSHQSATQMIFEIDGSAPVDWNQVKINNKNESSLSEAHTAIALNTTNIFNEDSPIFLILLSNQHVVSDYLANGASQQLTQRGAVVAVMEYPGYGVSVGFASKRSWLKATSNALEWIHQLTEKKIFLVGHSIGGPLALEAASLSNNKDFVAGAISYGGFTNIYQMAKDHVDHPILEFFSGPISWTLVRDHNFNGLQMDRLARHQTPALVLQGLHDGAVRPHHFYTYQKAIREALRDYPQAILEATLFENLYHEEVNDYNEFTANGFNTVWDRIDRFVNDVKGFANRNFY